MTNDELFSKLSERIEEIIARLEGPIQQYLKTRDELITCNVSNHKSYKNNFAQFYRLGRRKKEWKDHYFALLEQSKYDTTVTFADILQQIKDRTGRVEPSFSSKLVATINPNQPVIDSVVLGLLGYKQPYYYQTDRLEQLDKLYQQLTQRMEGMLQDSRFENLKIHFLTAYPSFGFTDVKILDFVLWQLREPKSLKKRVISH